MSRTRAELAIAVCGALTFGALLASFMAFRPVRDALVLDGDPDQIPWLFTTTFIAVSLVTPLWATVVAKAVLPTSCLSTAIRSPIYGFSRIATAYAPS